MEGGDQSCIECEMESVAWVKVVGLAVGLVVACLLLVAAYLCYQKMAARGAKKDAGTLRSAPRTLSSLYGTIAASAAHEWLKTNSTQAQNSTPAQRPFRSLDVQVGEAQFRLGRRGAALDLRQGA
jgi:hypothetical protein